MQKKSKFSRLAYRSPTTLKQLSFTAGQGEKFSIARLARAVFCTCRHMILLSALSALLCYCLRARLPWSNVPKASTKSPQNLFWENPRRLIRTANERWKAELKFNKTADKVAQERRGDFAWSPGENASAWGGRDAREGRHGWGECWDCEKEDGDFLLIALCWRASVWRFATVESE